jgi:hypothetical protein
MAEVKNIPLEALERHCEAGDLGRLDFRRGAFEGQIFTGDRFIAHAQLAGLEGVPALFRLFDWGDAETTWHAGLTPEKPSLRLTMPEASQLYAENLQERIELEANDRERIERVLGTPEEIAAQAGGIESVLKNYTISLECTDETALPGGFIFSDAAKSSYVIGSSDDADVVLRNTTVDPLHCGIILERGSVLVWDLGAASGVKLNGQAVTQDILKVGDVMSLGALDLRVRFQLRRPTLKLKQPAAPTATGKASGQTGPVVKPSRTTSIPSIAGDKPATEPLPKLSGPPAKDFVKGAITYDKVQKQLRKNAQGASFLDKLGSIFGKKK